MNTTGAEEEVAATPAAALWVEVAAAVAGVAEGVRLYSGE